MVKFTLLSPPPVDANVGRARKPGVEDVDAADRIRSQQRFLERRVVVEPQALPEPVDRINDHYSTGRVLFFLFERGQQSFGAHSTFIPTTHSQFLLGRKNITLNKNWFEKEILLGFNNAVQLL